MPCCHFVSFDQLDAAPRRPLTTLFVEANIFRPFDYSAKTRQDYELPVCSVEDSHLIARGNSDVPPLISDGEPVIGQTSANFLFGRQVVGGEDYSCGPDRPCKNGACCPKKTLQCNYGEESVPSEPH